MQTETQTSTPELFSIPAEQSVLGQILLDVDSFGAMGAHARDDLFYDPVHRALFAEICRRVKAGEFVNPVALGHWANQHEACRELNGAVYVVNLSTVAQAHAFQDYLHLLDGLRAKRELAAALNHAQEQIAEANITAADVAGGLEAALSGGVADTAKGPVSMTSAVTAAVERVNNAQNGIVAPGVMTGLPSLDRLVRRFSPGQLIVLGGRPGMGKSALAIEIAVNVARAGSPVCFASLEMPEEEIASRVISAGTSAARTAVEYSGMVEGDLTPAQWDAVGTAAREAGDLPIDFLDQSYREIGSLFAGAKQVQARRGGLGLVVVDYLQLLRAPGKSRYEQITEISIGLKVLARQLGVPVLALAQLSRSVEGRDEKRPTMADLRDSGQIEQDADKVLFCFREAYYLAREEPELDGSDEAAAAHEKWSRAMDVHRYRLEVIVAKQRQGAIGTAQMNYAPALNRFWGA